MLHINANFCAGSIVVKSIADTQVKLGIRHDTNSEFAQWFYFKVNGIQKKQLNFSIDELDKTAYPEGWSGYNVCASFDNVNWFRISSNYNDNTKTISWQINESNHNTIYFAYFEPYSYERHQQLIGKANLSTLCTHQIIGYTAQNNPLDLLHISKSQKEVKPAIWISARQHPGETMAEWFIEGLLEKLLNPLDAIATKLLSQYDFYIIPNMNPDGSRLGNLRTNSLGVNLNREWLTPTIEKSPEVYYTREMMLKTGVEMFFDIHGDESLPYVFTSGCSDNKSFSAKQEKLETKFEQVYKSINPNYQTEVGYPKNHFSVESSTVATKWVGNQFDCLAFTLEMPFKDDSNYPNLTVGWNGSRSKQLGADLLIAINSITYLGSIPM